MVSELPGDLGTVDLGMGRRVGLYRGIETLVLSLVFASGLVGLSKASAAPGDLDPSFARHGVRPLGGPAVRDISIAATSDGGYLQLRTPDDGSASLRRFTADGSLDKSFATDGAYDVPPGFFASDVEVQPDGDAVLVGSLPDPGFDEYDLAVIRLQPSGQPATGLGADGMTRIDLPNGSSYGADAVGTSDNETVVAAEVGPNQAALAKVTTTGDLDTSFGTDGVTGPIEGRDPRISATPDGDFLLNSTEDGLSLVSRVAQYDSSGGLHGSYGTSGVATLPEIPKQLSGGAFGFASDSSGGALIGVEADGFSFLRRLGPQGNADSAFDASEAFAFDRGNYRQLSASDLKIDSADRIMILGSYSIERARASVPRPALARLLPSGGLDPSFSRGGVSDFPPGTLHTQALFSLALSSDGVALAGGESAVASFLLGAGPHNADADFTADAGDACPLVPHFSAKGGGCPRLRVHLSASFHRHRHGHHRRGFDGTLKAPRGCRVISPDTSTSRSVKIRVLRARRGRRDKVIGSSKVNRSTQRWKLKKVPKASGRFYAKYPSLVDPELGICRAKRSRALKVHIHGGQG